MKRHLTSVLTALLLVGCSRSESETKIDASSDRAFHASVYAIARQVPEEKFARFMAAANLVRKQSFIEFMSTHTTAELAQGDRTAKMSLNGLTADQVIAQGDKIPPQPKVVQAKSEMDEIPPLSDAQLDEAAIADAEK